MLVYRDIMAKIRHFSTSTMPTAPKTSWSNDSFSCFISLRSWHRRQREKFWAFLPKCWKNLLIWNAMKVVLDRVWSFLCHKTWRISTFRWQQRQKTWRNDHLWQSCSNLVISTHLWKIFLVSPRSISHKTQKSPWNLPHKVKFMPFNCSLDNKFYVTMVKIQ